MRMQSQRNTCNANDKKGDLTEKVGNIVRKDPQLAYRKGEIHAVIQHDLGTVSPDIVEQLEHNADRFVPY
jgi:hypothetical protein